MESTVSSLEVAGARTVVAVLAEIRGLIREIKDDMEIYLRVLERFTAIYAELQKMESEQRLPPSDGLSEYTTLLRRYLEYLTRCQDNESAKRTRGMADELFALNEDLDKVANRLNMATTTGALTQWRQHWEANAPPVATKRAKLNESASSLTASTRVPTMGSMSPPSTQPSAGNQTTRQEPSIAFLVAMLQTGSDDQKQNASASVCRLALKDPNQEAITKAGGVAPLVALVTNGTGVQKANAAIALWALATNFANQVAIAEAGGIPPLVAMVINGTETQKENAAAALWNVATNAANKVAIAEAGGIPPLVSMVMYGNDIQKEKAAGALWNLAFNNANQVAIANAGGIAPLVALVTYGNAIQKENAVAALAKLAGEQSRYCRHWRYYTSRGSGGERQRRPCGVRCFGFAEPSSQRWKSSQNRRGWRYHSARGSSDKRQRCSEGQGSRFFVESCPQQGEPSCNRQSWRHPTSCCTGEKW